MPTPGDLAALDYAWSRWTDRSATPPLELVALVERLRDEADRDVREATFGAPRAEAIACQIQLTVAFDRLHGRGARQPGSPLGCPLWESLATLAHGATGAARAELVQLAVAAAGGAGHLEPTCLAALAPLLDPTTARSWVLSALATEGLEYDDQGALIGVLPAEDVEILLPPRIERAAAIEDSSERWSALYGLVDAVPERWKRRAIDASRTRHGVELDWGRTLTAEEDEAFEQALAAKERSRWGAPHTAWRLGQSATNVSAAERGPILDRAIDAFAAIALTPTSPGNDEGPFWAIAGMLDEAQVRRALAVVDRMEGADWNGDLGAARAALIARLARLGHADEAQRLIVGIGVEHVLAMHWRAVAWGRVLGARLLLDPSLRFKRLFADTAADPAHDDPAWRFRILFTLPEFFADAGGTLDAANLEAILSVARSFDAHSRALVLESMVQCFPSSLPVQRWIELAIVECEGEGRVAMLIALADARRDAGLDLLPAIRPLIAYLEEVPCADPVYTFRDLCDLRQWITPEDALPRWTDFLHHLGDIGARHAVSTVHPKLADVLEWLAGPDALLSVGRALVRADARFV